MTWNPYVVTTPAEAKAILDLALADEPLLCGNGMDVADAEDSKRRGVSRRLLEAELERDRAYLREHLVEVAACADWVKLQQRSRSFFRGGTSYSFKHAVERRLAALRVPLYVSNGAFIAAAIGLEHEAKRVKLTPNAVFRFAASSVQRYQYVVSPRHLAQARSRIVREEKEQWELLQAGERGAHLASRLFDRQHLERVAEQYMLLEVGEVPPPAHDVEPYPQQPLQQAV